MARARKALPKKIQKEKTPALKKAKGKRGTALRKISVKASTRTRVPNHAAMLRLLRLVAIKERTLANTKKPHQLARHDGNPIVEPRENSFWEMI